VIGKSVHAYAGNSRAVVFIYGYGIIRIAFKVRKALAGGFKMLNIEPCERQIQAKLMFFIGLILSLSEP
jgi:hypothetical protein